MIKKLIIGGVFFALSAALAHPIMNFLLGLHYTLGRVVIAIFLFAWVAGLYTLITAAEEEYHV